MQSQWFSSYHQHTHVIIWTFNYYFKDIGKIKGKPHKTILHCYKADCNKAYKYSIFRRVRKIAKSDY
jgi:plasmid rolling circle replication initiator protein Rep